MTNIKELRQKTGLSQKEFAGRYSLSVRTLQQWEQGISEPMEALLILIEKDIDCSFGLRHLYKHPKTLKWKICIDDPFINCEKVYPIQQSGVKELIDDILKNDGVKSITVFGSSVTDRCSIFSDIDIYVEADGEIEIHDYHDFEYDLWTDRSADDRLKTEIRETGVKVYEKY
ncbi:MAG: helix-turn-helix domain-containing protein [Erysipelotrichaceae bacterium]|nr:helix-turn-helix domain-containing protein [Erysipelotrichaceae bacterium]